MEILDRFTDIIKANINDVLDKCEDPAKMIDQYLRDFNKNLAEVKQETAGVMAEETRTKRLVDENAAEIERLDSLARKALQASNEDDARTFLVKKQQLEAKASTLQTTYTVARENAEKMRLMHDKLAGDIETLNERRDAIHAKVAVAKTQDKVNKLTSNTDKATGALNSFDRMEAKADKMLDQANAMAELNQHVPDEIATLEKKYAATGDTVSVEEELTQLKKEMGL